METMEMQAPVFEALLLFHKEPAALESERIRQALAEKFNGADFTEGRYLLHAFAEMGLPCFEPLGAFYAFPCIKEFGMTSDEFASRLLKEEKVAVVPGSAFGECGEGYLRISYAYSLEDLKKALDRMADFVKRLKEEGSR